MRDQADFTSYAAARWPRVVRTLVLLGVPPRHASELAGQAFARCRAEWEHHDAYDDLDAELYRTVLECKDEDHTAWWDEPAFEDEAWAEVEPALDRLPPLQRAELLLRHVAGLPDAQVAAVVGRQGRVATPTADQVQDVAQVVPVVSPDLDEIAALAARRRSRRRDLTVAATVASIVLAGVAAVLVTRAGSPDSSSGQDLEPVPVERVETTVPVGWYADGQLHLPHVTLEVQGVRALATISSGAVYADTEGRLVFVSEEGLRTLLDEIGDDGSFAVSDEDGLVAWIVNGENPELVVHDLIARQDVERLEILGSGWQVVAIDSGSVFYRDDQGDVELVVGDESIQRITAARLLDVASKVRVFAVGDDAFRVVQPLFNIQLVRRGVGAKLSHSGDYVLTGLVDPAPSERAQVTIYDTRSGDRLPTDVQPGERVLDAVWGPADTVTYALVTDQDPGRIELRSCSLRRVYLPSGELAPRCSSEYTRYETSPEILLAS